MDSEDDYLYDDSGDESQQEEEEEEEDDDYEAAEDDYPQAKQENYTVLNEEDISQRQEEDITTLSSVLIISRESASILLRHFHWNVGNVHEAWFADEEKVRREVGLLESPVFQIPHEEELIVCRICLEFFPIDEMNHAAACGHPFCSSCWTGYISSSIADGPCCLMLQCPEPDCFAAVGEEMIDLLASSDEDRKRYQRYLLRSFVEDNKRIKWCPAPGCDYAVDFVVGSGSYDVSCKCTNNFCWNCIEEAHSPVDCSTVAMWIMKNCSEAENTNWILANSKQCPKCRRNIEKNQGCMHMTCSAPCSFQFCWLCLGDWQKHGEATGGYYACNGYTKAKAEGLFDEEEKRKEMAKNSLERYTHYYERWANNQSSRLKAAEGLKKTQSVHMKKLTELYSEPETMLEFITDAWLQVIECRRVLKWTYAYGYYLPEIEYARRMFFEYLQGEAESGLERLHQCAEKELLGYLDSNGPSKDFNEFRKKLTGLTSVTRTYFENLVRELENGLSVVETQGDCSKSKNFGATKGKKGKHKNGSQA